MDRGDILSGAAFTAALRSAAVFLVVLTLMAVFSARLIDGAMTEEIRLLVLDSEAGLLREMADEEVVSAADRVALVARAAAGRSLAVALYSGDGQRLAGNLALRPPPGGWLQAPVALDAAGPEDGAEPYLLHAAALDGGLLVTGRSLAIVDTARRTMIRGFALTGFLVSLAMLAIGFAQSRRSQAKLERIERTLDRVSHGDTAARTGVGAENDQIDRISLRIDSRLDALDELVQGTRRTATSVAHDLRRPLARAALSLERALLRAEAGADPRAEIEETQRDLARLTSIISTILRIARIEGGGVPAMRVIDLRPVLDEVAETFRPVAEDAGQVFDYERPARPLMLRGDAEMLAQLAVNLVQNAITHAGPGARVLLAGRDGAEGVELVVADSGPGVPEALRTKVFEPFFRSDSARTVEGSGLGLPLVKAIANRHGARVALEDAAPGLRVRVVFAPPEAD